MIGEVKFLQLLRGYKFEYLRKNEAKFFLRRSRFEWESYMQGCGSGSKWNGLDWNRINFGSWVRIRTRIKSWIRIHIEVTSWIWSKSAINKVMRIRDLVYKDLNWKKRRKSVSLPCPFITIWWEGGIALHRPGRWIWTDKLRILCTGDPYYVLYTALLIS
jgi:hypothetical protein